MIVVSDTSPISSLFLINQLQLLPDLFGSIILPKKVMEELLLLQTDFGYDLSPVFNNEWLIVREVSNREAVVRFQQILDIGESEAIVLAKELRADYLLVDESEGRAVAVSEGLHTIGVLGVLLKAKNLGKITLVKPHLEALKTKANFYIHGHLYQKILRQAGEV
jgi:uncharacterized protein